MGPGFESSWEYQIMEGEPSRARSRLLTELIVRGYGSIPSLSAMVGRKAGVLIGLENRDGGLPP